jgi:putative oxidoreductase
MKKYLTLANLVKVVVAVILLQTLFFKLTGAEESVYIFTQVGMEPWGRIGSAIVELIASVLILIPATTWLGALLALGTISGALFFHFTKLGFVIMDDGGTLFILACIVFVGCLFLLWKNWKHIPLIGKPSSSQS